MVPAPVFAGRLGNGIEVRRLAAHIHHAINRTGTSQYAPAHPDFRCVGIGRLRLAGIGPDVAGVGHDFGEAFGHVDEGVGIFRAGFKQGNAHARIFGQPVGQDATRRAGADDDVVEVGHS